MASIFCAWYGRQKDDIYIAAAAACCWLLLRSLGRWCCCVPSERKATIASNKYPSCTYRVSRVERFGGAGSVGPAHPTSLPPQRRPSRKKFGNAKIKKRDSNHRYQLTQETRRCTGGGSGLESPLENNQSIKQTNKTKQPGSIRSNIFYAIKAQQQLQKTKKYLVPNKLVFAARS